MFMNIVNGIVISEGVQIYVCVIKWFLGRPVQEGKKTTTLKELLHLLWLEEGVKEQDISFEKSI